MAMRLWPRSIRLQMLAGLMLVEVLSILLFATLLTRQQTNEVYERAQHRLSRATGYVTEADLRMVS